MNPVEKILGKGHKNPTNKILKKTLGKARDKEYEDDDESWEKD